ncbi:MAG: hypothetical protein ABIJ34_08040 [archaeon]
MTIVKPTSKLIREYQFGEISGGHTLLVFDAPPGNTVQSMDEPRQATTGDLLVSINAATDLCYIVAPNKFIFFEKHSIGYGRMTGSGIVLIGESYSLKDVVGGLEIVASDDNLHRHLAVCSRNLPQELSWLSYLAETDQAPGKYCDALLDRVEHDFRHSKDDGPCGGRDFNKIPHAPLLGFFGSSGYIVATPTSNSKPAILIDVMGKAPWVTCVDTLVKRYTHAKHY